MNTKEIAALTGGKATAIDAVAFANSLKGQDSKSINAAGAGVGEWLGGIAFGSYTDVFESNGALKTFPTAATKDLPKEQQKVGGRIVKSEAGKEVKLYKRFLARAIEAKAKGITMVVVDGDEYPMLKGAAFGIVASEDTAQPKQEYNGTSRHPLKHEAITSAPATK